jgi:hypothetical protein
MFLGVAFLVFFRRFHQMPGFLHGGVHVIVGDVPKRSPAGVVLCLVRLIDTALPCDSTECSTLTRRFGIFRLCGGVDEVFTTWKATTAMALHVKENNKTPPLVLHTMNERHEQFPVLIFGYD